MRKIIRMLALLLLMLFLPLSLSAQDYIEHVVKKGETLASIASYYKVSEETLKNENPILKSYIYTGMKIRIPGIQHVIQSTENDVEKEDANKEEENELDSAGYESFNDHPSPITNDSRVQEETLNTKSTKLSRKPFGDFSLIYQNAFDAEMKYGQYGIQASFYPENSLGFVFGITTNFKYGNGTNNYLGVTYNRYLGGPTHLIFPLYAGLGIHLKDESHSGVWFSFGGITTGVRFAFDFGGFVLSLGPLVSLGFNNGVHASFGYNFGVGFNL